MSLHIFANIVTSFGTAANNRAETEGNITTLQKLIWQGMPHTTVSAESIRFALRRLLAGLEKNGTNRRWDEDERINEWKDWQFSGWNTDDGATYIDDDLLGFMTAEAAKAEAEESEGAEEPPAPAKPKKGKEKAKGTANVRRAVLEITRAVSLTPWSGDVTFNAASPGATPSAQKKGINPVPYGAEVHATRYQYGLALTPDRLRDTSRAAKAITALCQLGTVAGNHGRFLYDFSPDSVVFRITHDPAPRFLYCFNTPDQGRTVDADALLARVNQGDIKAGELILGGPIASSGTGRRLTEMGASVPGAGGVLAAGEEAARRINAALKIEG